MPAAVFESAVERLCPEIPESVLQRGAGIPIDAMEQAYLRSQLKAVMQDIGNPVSPLVCATIRSKLEIELLEAFMVALRNGCKSISPPPELRVTRRVQRLKQARDYLTEHLHETISMADLCGEMGMSRRGVEMLFKDSLGIGPNTFLRHQRLSGTRRALLTAPRLSGTVKQIALAWGFWHLGHFAREYRELFGENPSMTLYRKTKPI